MPLKTQVRDLEFRFIHAAGGTDTLKGNGARWSETSDEKIPNWTGIFHNPNSRVVGKIKDGDDAEIWLRRDSEGALTRVFTGVVGKVARRMTSGRLSLVTVTGNNWEAKLLTRHVSRDVRTKLDIGKLIHEVMDGNDIGIDLSLVADPFGKDVEGLRFDYIDWREFLHILAAHASAGWHIDKDRKLHFYLRGTVDSGVSENGSGGVDFNFDADSEMIENVIRGFGGTEKILQSEQPTAGAFKAATSSVTLNKKLRWPREEMPQMNVFARAKVGSTSNLEVSLEADNGSGSPSGTPLVRYIVNANELPSSGGAGEWLKLPMPRHTLAPGNDVHLLVKGTTPIGVDVGVDNGVDQNLAYQAYIGVDLVSEVSDEVSISTYGRREGRPIRDPNILTREELELKLRLRLEAFKTPRHAGTFEAVDPVYLTIPLGRYVTANFPELDAGLNGKRLSVVERLHEVQAHHYALSVSVADGEREREAGMVMESILRRLEELEQAGTSPRQNFLLQLIGTSDNIASSTDAASLVTQASGTFNWGTMKWGLGDWA